MCLCAHIPYRIQFVCVRECARLCYSLYLSITTYSMCWRVLVACMCLLSGSISQKSRGSCQRWLPWFSQWEGYTGDETSLTVPERKKKKPSRGVHEELESTTKTQEVSLLFMTASLYNCMGYTSLLQHLWRGAIARIPPSPHPPEALIWETVCLPCSCLTSPSHLMHSAYPARSLLGLQ